MIPLPDVKVRLVDPDAVEYGKLKVNRALHDFIANEVLNRNDLEGFPTVENFWNGYAKALETLGQQNLRLLRKRMSLQKKLDMWCSFESVRELAKESAKTGEWEKFKKQEVAFLRSIGYLVDRVDVTNLLTKVNLDEDIFKPAPQLVAPLKNPRFALNGANARWGSLIDAAYYSNVLKQPPPPASDKIDKARRAEAIKWAVNGLNKVLPSSGYINPFDTHARLVRDAHNPSQIRVVFEKNGKSFGLDKPDDFKGYSGAIEVGEASATGPYTLLFKNHSLYIQVVFDPTNMSKRGKELNSVADIIMESVPTTIQDCEDSVAVVSGDEKIALYSHWLKLMLGTLTASVSEPGTVGPPKLRSCNQDYVFTPSDQTVPEGAETFSPIVLSGRSLLLIRHTAHHVYTNLVLYNDKPTPETFLDAFVTALIALYDIRNVDADKTPPRLRNSHAGYMYVVKPKLHGPEEVAFANKLFESVEDTLSLPRLTIKFGLMDEERRTSLNLTACVAAVKDRIFFINTGFLDRMADEIRSSFYLAPVSCISVLRNSNLVMNYIGLDWKVAFAANLQHCGQVTTGMWTSPDALKELINSTSKDCYLRMGLVSWIPSPKAGTLLSLEYHQASEGFNKDPDVIMKELNNGVDKLGEMDKELQREILPDNGNVISKPPYSSEGSLVKYASPQEQIRIELEDTLNRVLNYVVRWIDSGIGCSKIPNRFGLNVMEDRATLRISSLHTANWIYHGVVTENQVYNTLLRLAATVQDKSSTGRTGDGPKFIADRPLSSVAYQTALDVISKCVHQINGYTEPMLCRGRLKVKVLKAIECAAEAIGKAAAGPGEHAVAVAQKAADEAAAKAESAAAAARKMVQETTEKAEIATAAARKAAQEAAEEAEEAAAALEKVAQEAAEKAEKTLLAELENDSDEENFDFEDDGPLLNPEDLCYVLSEQALPKKYANVCCPAT